MARSYRATWFSYTVTSVLTAMAVLYSYVSVQNEASATGDVPSSFLYNGDCVFGSRRVVVTYHDSSTAQQLVFSG